MAGHWFTITVQLDDGQDVDVARGIVRDAVRKLDDIHRDAVTVDVVEGDTP